MTTDRTCHDPYREVELYLEQAQEEIVKAFQDLQKSGETDNESLYMKVGTTNALPCLKPDNSCCIHSKNIAFHDCLKKTLSSPVPSVSLSRVCYDGCVLDLDTTGYSKVHRSRPPLRKSLSSPPCHQFFSTISTSRSGSLPDRSRGVNTGSDKEEYLNGFSEFDDQAIGKTRQRSMSDVTTPYSSRLRDWESDYEYFPRPPSGDVHLLSAWADKLAFEINKTCEELQLDEESVRNSSYNSSQLILPSTTTECRTLGLNGYVHSSISSIQNDNQLKSSEFTIEKDVNNIEDEQPKVDIGICPAAVHAQQLCPSPDSGIDQLCCDVADGITSPGTTSPPATRDIEVQTSEYETSINGSTEKVLVNEEDCLSDHEECKDSANGNQVSGKNIQNSKSICDGGKVDQTTLDSPEDIVNFCSFHPLNSNKSGRSILVTGDSVLIIEGEKQPSSPSSEKSLNMKKINRQARLIPKSVSQDEEDRDSVETSCILLSYMEKQDSPLLRKKLLASKEDGTKLVQDELGLSCSQFVEQNIDAGVETNKIILPKNGLEEVQEFDHSGNTEISDHFAEHSNFEIVVESLPEKVKYGSLPGNHQVQQILDSRLVSSLPRGKCSSPVLLETQGHQRSVSSSAVASISHAVSRQELEDFMRRVKISTYHPPPENEEVPDGQNGTIMKEKLNTSNEDQNGLSDIEQKDAITQTTPQNSRSSSITWVTECECSDIEGQHRSGSEESLLFSCSNCTSDVQSSAISSSSSCMDSEEESDPQSNGLKAQNGLLEAVSGLPNRSNASLSNSSGNSKLSALPEILKDVPLRGNHDTICGVQDKRYCNSTVNGINKDAQLKGIHLSVIPSNVDCEPQYFGQSSSFPSVKMGKTKEPQSTNGHSKSQGILTSDLNVKSASAPVLRPQRRIVINGESVAKLLKDPHNSAANASGEKNKVFLTPKSQSSKELNELQAIEACAWLRAAGFPQYAQMYEDNLFPIDIGIVQKDHTFLDPDSIQSLFRRLNTLNRCARMKIIDNVPRKAHQPDESDEEEQCALSTNWQFQRTSRRWSRLPSPPASIIDPNNEPPSPKYSSSPGRKYLTPEEAYSSSHDSVFIEEQQSSPDSIRRSTGGEDRRHNAVSPIPMEGSSPASSSGSGGCSEDLLEKVLDIQPRGLRRSGSDRIREGAKALLKRMESLKGKRKKKKNVETQIPSTGDVTVDMSLNTSINTDVSPSSSTTPSPQLSRPHVGESPPQMETSDGSHGSTPQIKHRKKGWSILCKGDSDYGAHSDSECPVMLVSERWMDSNCNDPKLIGHYMPTLTLTNGTQREWRKKREENSCSIHESNSLYSDVLRNTCPQEKKSELRPARDSDKRGSYYDNIPTPLVMFNRTSLLDKEGQDIIIRHNSYKQAQANPRQNDRDQDSLTAGDAVNDDVGDWPEEAPVVSTERRDSGVGSSLTRHTVLHCSVQAPWHCFPIQPSTPVYKKSPSKGVFINSLTAPQLMVLRKLSLLKLTTLMEKYSPSSRTGWNWGVPKFIRRIRAPDYKDKAVFGVPLLVVLQRTGQPLPGPIQSAIHYLKKTALDSTGLFRKSGVRSRIQKLRNLNETSPEKVAYDEQQAYDVADMIKQYFRELPEALLTNKLSETFISIYQHIPEELRLGAVQAAILLMPDENREVLQCLLAFLLEVCQHAGENQMTATNLAVCFAPSLFHLNTPRSSSASPRRRKTVGVPDQRELNENRAAYECLTSMILEYKQLFTISEEQLSHCHLSYLEECEPTTLDQLSNVTSRGHCGWRSYVDSCIQTLLKEARDKYKGWLTLSQTDNTELAFKKLDDSHPLRLWKVSSEMEAPPSELLHRILRERHAWDTSILKWRCLAKIDKQTEIFQYVCGSLFPNPACDFCILRSWRTDLPKGACVLVEFSVEHPDATLLMAGVRGIVLASRYLIEPCGSGKSRVTHITRVDMRGRSPEWYNKAYGHICSLYITRLRDSFNHGADGPETKV